LFKTEGESGEKSYLGRTVLMNRPEIDVEYEEAARKEVEG